MAWGGKEGIIAKQNGEFAKVQGDFAKTEGGKAKQQADLLEGKQAKVDKAITDSAEAIQITEQLVDGSFDSGLLNTNINKKLNDLETQYAPKLTSVTEQLAETGQEINIVKTDVSTNYAKKADLNNLASNKADITYVDTITQSLASGSPKGTYATLAALQTAFPTGNANIYVVTADGNWYYWNNTAWTSGGIYQSTGLDQTLRSLVTDSINEPMKNLIDNADFNNSTGNWLSVGGAKSAVNNTLVITGGGTSLEVQARYTLPITYVIKEKLYLAAKIRVTNSLCTSIRLRMFDGTNFITKTLNNPIMNEWYNFGDIFQSTSTTTPTTGVARVDIIFNYADATSASGQKGEIQKPLAINLSTIFGLGKEPLLGEFDDILTSIYGGWFKDKVPFVNTKVYLQSKSIESLKSDVAAIQVPENVDLTGIESDVLTLQNKVLVLEETSPNRYTPNPPRLMPSKENRGSGLPIDNNADILFARNSSRYIIQKSLDWWGTSSTFYDLTPKGGKIAINNGVALSDNSLLIAFEHDTDTLQNGWYIIDNNGRFDKVLTPITSFNSEGFGIDKYPLENPQIILLTEYGRQNVGDYARHVHLSVDKGESWRTIFEMAEVDPTHNHTHSAHYDPFGDRIYVCTGDRAIAANLYYSDNWRNQTPTWTKVWNDGQAPVQFTSIFSTESMLLFGTDGVGKNGLYGVVRDTTKIKQEIAPNIKPLLVIDELPFTTYVARRFTKDLNGRGYYLTLSDSGEPDRKGAIILGSGDGKTWFELYRGQALSTHNWHNVWVNNGELIWWEFDQKCRAIIEWGII